VSEYLVGWLVEKARSHLLLVSGLFSLVLCCPACPAWLVLACLVLPDLALSQFQVEEGEAAAAAAGSESRDEEYSKTG
jgi:hypothetical protein